MYIELLTKSICANVIEGNTSDVERLFMNKANSIEEKTVSVYVSTKVPITKQITGE
jgi:hypothetical protein